MVDINNILVFTLNASNLKTPIERDFHIGLKNKTQLYVVHKKTTLIYICWVTEKAREFQKNIYLCFID